MGITIKVANANSVIAKKFIKQLHSKLCAFNWSDNILISGETWLKWQYQ